MYRYIVDNAVTFTPDDLVLFSESPFAVWMERLTLENPEHGILPDIHGTGPAEPEAQQESIVETLRAEGRQVAAIDWEIDEAQRRAATLAAMRDGVDFIVNGQLADGVLSGSTNLLMRTSGYSELGDFLYIPCETQSSDGNHASFRLAFAANLLHRLQGQLPPQMLIIRDGADVVPLQTEDHIYYYWAVQKRFMQAMNTFRKHRMPDPSESAHFGRWSECASEVLKQRALREEYQSGHKEEEEAIGEETGEEQREDAVVQIEQPLLRVASGSANSPYAKDGPAVVEARATDSGGSSPTLAEQARMLAPDSFRSDKAPGHTPNLARFPRPVAVAPHPEAPETEHHRRSSDAVLRNLDFIGSHVTLAIPLAGEHRFHSEEGLSAPAPSLRGTAVRAGQTHDLEDSSESDEVSEPQTAAPLFLPPDPALGDKHVDARPAPQCPLSDSLNTSQVFDDE